MYRMRGWAGPAAALVVLLLSAAGVGSAQFGAGDGTPGSPGQISSQNESEAQGPVAAWNAQRLRALNADRHKTMVSDAEKLLKLARQLDAEVASNPRDELTPEEMRKLGEIEKLARNVKSKMALSFTGGPALRSPAIPVGGLGTQRTQ